MDFSVGGGKLQMLAEKKKIKPSVAVKNKIKASVAWKWLAEKNKIKDSVACKIKASVAWKWLVVKNMIKASVACMWLAVKNKIKASVAWKWLAVKAQKNMIKVFQEEIDKRNKAAECMADYEKELLEQADVALKNANKYVDIAPLYLEIKKLCELHAKKCVASRRTAISEVVAFEEVMKREIDRLHSGDFTPQMSYLFY